MAKRARRYWLFKSEPSEFSFDDLWSAERRTTFWDGVRNYQARNFLRDDMQPGDAVLFYHSNAAPTGVAGVAEVASRGYPDPTQFVRGHAHYDPKARPEAPTWYGVDLRARECLPRVVTLAELKQAPGLAQMGLLRRGSRLSVQPVTATEFDAIVRMARARARS